MKVYCGISYHGFGHIAQLAPLINRLHQVNKISDLTIQCAAPTTLLQSWFTPGFTHIEHPTDLGIAMFNAVKVDVETTYSDYLAQHNNRAEDITKLETYIQQSNADLVITNNSHLLSRAAHNLGVPCVHVGSLNWADHFREYCNGRPLAEDIFQTLCDDYNCAQTFFRLPPHMPMDNFNNVVNVGPICRVGTRINLKQHFGHSENYHYILVSMGGMAYPIDFDHWNTPANFFFVYAGSGCGPNQIGVHINQTQLSHQDLVASCDVIITKPGNGTYAEAACVGTPILYLPREDWPEESHLNHWQKQRGFCQSISEQQLLKGELEKAIQQAMASQPKFLEKPTGIEDVIRYIAP